MEVVVGAAERYATGGDVADVALDVGIDHVLRRYAEVGGGVEELFPAFGPVDRQQAREGLVVTVEAGPGEGDHQPVALRLRQPRRFVDVADHRAVAGAADLQRDRLAVAHGDAFQARLEGPVAVRGQVAPRVLGIDALQVGVLDVRAGIGVAPGDALVMADDEQRGAGEVGAGEAQAGDLQAGQVEGRRVGQAQVWIVGQQRLAGGAAAGGDHPVVRTDASTLEPGSCPSSLPASGVPRRERYRLA